MNLENNLHLNMLVQSLQLLAADYEEQVKALPEFVDVPDEIALTFNEAYLLIENFDKEGLMTTSQKMDLRQIDSALEQMSKGEDVWTLNALKTSSQWEDVRLLASNALKAFNIPKQAPDLFWLRYIPDQKTPTP
jgi:hypothetical protein